MSTLIRRRVYKADKMEAYSCMAPTHTTEREGENSQRISDGAETIEIWGTVPISTHRDMHTHMGIDTIIILLLVWGFWLETTC